MEFALFVVILFVVCICWLNLRQRFEDLERRINDLQRRIGSSSTRHPSPPVQSWPVRVYPPANVPPPPPRVQPRAEPSAPKPAPADTATVPPGPIPASAFLQPDPPRAPQPDTRDWEAVLGGNWLNKAGMLILVIGMALALGYSFTYMGPAGRVATCLAASAAIITAGVMLESRERYRTFARGLIGGGWAGLYITVYAMHAVDAARVVSDPWIAAILLIAVAIGMIAHSLRYRSQTVSGLAYFIAYFTLAITEVNLLSVTALVPLAASLLYVARRFGWRHFAVLGAAATYITCAMRGDSGAPLWQAQTIFAVYWLLFEAYDVLTESDFLMPLNAAGFLGLSMVKWSSAAPDRMWQFLAGAAVAYLVSAGLRIRTGRWFGPLAVAAGLAAGAFLLKLDREWSALALLAEAEILYLAGVRLPSSWLRYLAVSVFAVQVCEVLLLPHSAAWTSLMVVTAVVFYANRFLHAADVWFSYAGAALAAILAYDRAPDKDPALAWMLLACVAAAAGWRGGRDLQYQAGGLAALSVLTMVARPDEPLHSMIFAITALYTAGLVLEEARPVHTVASGLLALLLYRQVSGSVLTVAWGAEGVLLLAAGFPLRDRVLRLSGMGLLLICILKLFLYDLSYLETLPRIFSFIVLGLLLVGVSWLYTRFRERIERYL